MTARFRVGAAKLERLGVLVDNVCMYVYHDDSAMCMYGVPAVGRCETPWRATDRLGLSRKLHSALRSCLCTRTSSETIRMFHLLKQI